MEDNFFNNIANRYGISVEALRDAWNKTRVPDPIMHGKRFKAYLTQLTGSDLHNYKIPEMNEEVQEDVILKLFLEDCAEIISQLEKSL